MATLAAQGTFRLAHLAANAWGRVRRRLRVGRTVRVLRLRAWWHRATLDLEVAPDLRLGRRVRIEIRPKTANLVRIGPGCRIADDVLIDLRGGRLLLGPGVDIRRGVSLGVGGALTLEGPNLVQQGVSLHCDEAVTLGPRVGLGEYVTLIDSSHHFEEPDRWFVESLRTAPVVLGESAWVGAKATVTKGVTLGARSIVGANSTVVKDVPAGVLVSGVPAQPVRGAAGEVRPRPRFRFGTIPPVVVPIGR